MSAADQKTVTEIFVNVAKSIAAFERTLRVKPNRFDAYVGGDLNALTKEEKTGLAAFFGTGCVQCHWGPRLTDDAFHPDRYPTGRQDGKADRGRIDGVAKLLASEFAQPHPNLKAHDRQLGSFKTTSLRGRTARRAVTGERSRRRRTQRTSTARPASRCPTHVRSERRNRGCRSSRRSTPTSSCRSSRCSPRTSRNESAELDVRPRRPVTRSPPRAAPRSSLRSRLHSHRARRAPCRP